MALKDKHCGFNDVRRIDTWLTAAVTLYAANLAGWAAWALWRALGT